MKTPLKRARWPVLAAGGCAALGPEAERQLEEARASSLVRLG